MSTRIDYTVVVATSPPWLTEEQRQAWRGLSLMLFQLQARLSRRLAEHGLSYQDYLVLATLSDQADGRRRVVELSDELGWEKSRLSHHISRMRERGLVRKAPCPNDQRGIYVMITALGVATLRDAAPDHATAVQHFFFRHLTDQQVQTLALASTKVLGGLADDGD